VVGSTRSAHERVDPVNHAHEIRVERLVPRAEHQRADRPEMISVSFWLKVQD
jgi:hypothetical protein